MKGLNKANHIVNFKLMTICLKKRFKGNFFVEYCCQCQPKVHLSILEGLSENTQALRHSKGTQGTLKALGHLGTWTLRPSGTYGTWAFEELYLADSCFT